MSPSVLRKSSRLERTAQGSMLMHPDFPLEQMVRSKDPAMRSQLSRELMRSQRTPVGDARYVPDNNGLRVLARSEDALHMAVAALCQRVETALKVDVPSVRYVFGALVLEPYMQVQLRGPDAYWIQVREEILGRRGHIYGIELDDGVFLLRAEAPLACLLGYAQELHKSSARSVALHMRLSRYVRIDHEGPEAA